jgi:pyruvate kinase
MTTIKTKIICTLGPATDDEALIGRLIDAGADVFRINMSHARPEWAQDVVERVRRQSARAEANIAVLFDLTGPSIRTGDLEEPLTLADGDVVEFRKQDAAPGVLYSTTVNYDGLMEDVAVGNTLVVDNGTLLMRIDTVRDDRIVCTVTTPGTLGSRRHINLPGVRLRLPSLTDKDRGDIALAVRCGADFIAGSFVRDAHHVAELRAAVDAVGGNAGIIAKIEDQEAVRHLDAIIAAADAVMIARGDLGIEVEFEELPLLQRRIVKRCHDLCTPVIVATQLLESMIRNPTPTRAEVTDVMNAAYEEADALMLSGETSVGLHPLRCVDVLTRVCSRIERSGGLGYGQQVQLRDERARTARAAVTLADSLPGCRIVVFTRRGVLAQQLAMLRPRTASFFAFTPCRSCCRRLALLRGVQAFELEFPQAIEDTVKLGAGMLREKGLVSSGDPMVIVSDISTGEFAANSILLHHA